MVEKKESNSPGERREFLIENGWVVIQDGKKGGEFAINTFANHFKSEVYNGHVFREDSFGSFLVWDPESYESKTLESEREVVQKESESLRADGWIVYAGILVLKDENRESSILVAIREKGDKELYLSPGWEKRKKATIVRKKPMRRGSFF